MTEPTTLCEWCGETALGWGTHPATDNGNRLRPSCGAESCGAFFQPVSAWVTNELPTIQATLVWHKNVHHQIMSTFQSWIDDGYDDATDLLFNNPFVLGALRGWQEQQKNGANPPPPIPVKYVKLEGPGNE